MVIKFDVTFIDGGITATLKEWPREFNKTIIQELVMIANDMRTHIIKEMKDSPPNFFKPSRRQGTKYKTNAKNRRHHYPSLPGNFPRIDSGRLAGSINVVLTDGSVGVGSVSGNRPVKYARKLEDPDGSNRPFIRPTYDKFAPTIENRILEAIKRVAHK